MSPTIPMTSRRRRSRWPLLVLFLGALALGTSGCESSTDGGGAETDAQALADEGFALLESQFNSGGVPDFSIPRAKFQEAVDLDPDNADANAGLAICELGALSQDPSIEAAIGGFTTPAILGRASPAARSPLFQRSLGGVEGAGAGMLDVSGLLDMTWGTLYRGTQDPATFGDLQDLAEAVILPVLERVAAALAYVEAHSGWSLTLSASVNGMQEGSLEIDLTDIYMLDAMVLGLKSWIHAVVAYDIDVPETVFTDTTAMKAAFDQDTGTFMTLRANGAANLGLSLSTINNAISRMTNFLSRIEGETDDQADDLIKIDPTGVEGPTQADLDSLSQRVTELFGALNFPVDVDGDFDGDGFPDSLTLDLKKLFNNPIANFKAKLPPYSWQSMYQSYIWDGYLTEQPELFVFPDGTFNGLFPDFTSPGDFEAFFGIVPFPSPGPFDFGTVAAAR